MSHRIIIHTCFNARDQKLVIYSNLCENFYRVAGYHSDGRLLFDGNIIEFHDVGSVVSEFTGKSIRYERNAKPIPTEHVTETRVIGSNDSATGSRKRGRPVGYRKPKVSNVSKPKPLPVQVAMSIPDVPVHKPKLMSQKEINNKLRLILKEAI